MGRAMANLLRYRDNKLSQLLLPGKFAKQLGESGEKVGVVTGNNLGDE